MFLTSQVYPKSSNIHNQIEKFSKKHLQEVVLRKML